MSIFLKSGTVKKQNNLYYSRGLNKYNQEELRKLAEEYNIDFLNKELLQIFVDAYLRNALGVSCPFPWKWAKRRGEDDTLYNNLKIVKKTAKSGKILQYSKKEGLSREIHIDQDEAMDVAIRLADITLLKISRDNCRKIIKICKEQKKMIVEKYTDYNIKQYVEYLHKSDLNTDYLISNVESLINNYNSQDQTESVISRTFLLNTVLEDLKYNNIVYNQSLNKSINYRIYCSMTGLKKIERDLIFKSEDGYCYLELDLTSAHPNIFQKLTGLQIDNMREKIINESGLEKMQVKRVINATLYGAGSEMIMAQLINDEEIRKKIEDELKDAQSYKDKHIAKQLRKQIIFPDNIYELNSKLKKSLTFNLVKKEINKLLVKINKDKKMTDGFGVVIHQRIFQSPAAILAGVCSSYEKLLIMPIAKFGKKLGYTIVLDSHDGVTIKVNDASKKEQIFLDIKKIIDKEAKKLGINTTLEVK